MTVPSVFASDFRYATLTGVTDVQTVMDKIDDEITAQLPTASRWTDLGSGVYKSPPQDPTDANRFMQVELIRDSATRLSFKIMDKSGSAIYDGAIDFTTSCDAKIWCGPYHLVVQLKYAGSTYEEAYAVMLDPTPFGLTMTPLFVIGYTRRNSTGTLVGNHYPDEAVLNDVYGASPVRRLTMCTPSAVGATVNGQTAGGSNIAVPIECDAQVTSGQHRWAGRPYQFITGPLTLSPEAVITVPLDDGVSGDFEVLGKAAPAGGYNGCLAVRRA